MGFLERLDRGDDRGGLGLVAFERLDHQRESGRVGEQPDGDLRLEPSFLGEPRLAEPVTAIGLEVQRRHVIQDQGCRSERRVRSARRRELLPPLRLGIHGQAALQRPIRRRGDAGLVQHTQRVELAGRLDDPRQHQLLEHLVPTRRVGEAECVVRAAQRLPQMPHPRRHNLQRPQGSGRVQPEVELILAGGKPLSTGRLERRKLSIIMSRADVLDIPRPTPRRMHDLHRRRPRRGPNRANIRHSGRLRTSVSAQIQAARTATSPETRDLPHQDQ